ncbi:hypothetical protein HN827_09660, partial [archaeon]|nr:hypothetical protein [archaeon]
MVGKLDYPGNLYSFDGINHYLVADHIATSEKFEFPPFLAFGKEEIANVIPPLFYMHVAPLFKFTGVEDWNIALGLSMIYNSLLIFLIYLFSSKLFNSKKIGLVSAILYVFPINIGAWSYYWYIGMFLQALGSMFLCFAIYFSYLYIKENKNWQLIVLCFLVVGIIMAHFSQILLLIPFLIIIFFKILKKEFSKKIINLIIYLNVLILSVILYIPRIIIFIENRKSYVNLGLNLTLNLGSINYPDLSFLSYPIIFLATLGLFYNFINYKKNKNPLYLLVFFLSYLFLLPFIFSTPYILRHRSLIPIFIYPFVAFAIICMIKKFKLEKHFLKIVILIFIINFIFAYGNYQEVKQELKDHPVLTLEDYNTLVWIRKNTPKNGFFLFVEGLASQSVERMSKRITFDLNIDERLNLSKTIDEKNDFPIGFPFRCNPKGPVRVIFGKEINPFVFEYYDVENCPN